MRSQLLSVILLLWVSVAHAEAFYVEDHGVLTQVNADPREIKVSEWQVRLYPEGMSPSGPNYWGLITGSSAASVKQQLQGQQQFDRIWEKSCGGGCKSKFTSFNPLGPIAIMSRLGPEPNKSIDLLFDQYADMLKDTIKGKEEGVGGQLKEYGKVVADGIYMVRQLRRALFQGTMVQAQIEAELAKALKSLDAARQAIGASRGSGRSSSAGSRGGLCDGKPMLAGERCCVDRSDPDLFMVCAAGAQCPPMPGMRCDP